MVILKIPEKGCIHRIEYGPWKGRYCFTVFKKHNFEFNNNGNYYISLEEAKAAFLLEII